MFDQNLQQALDIQIIKPGRVALGVEYLGSNYSGWQRQSHVDSVQKRIEIALEKILRHKANITCAGRTDAGVNATGQVVHLDTLVSRPMKAFTRGINTNLPHDIAIRWAKPVDADFDARYSASARTYRYIIHNQPLRPAILNAGLTHVYYPLNSEDMNIAAQALVGEHDFTSFRASHCQSNTPFRNVMNISVNRHGHYVVLEITANAFLHHMVRNIMGALIDVGTGEYSPDYIEMLLNLKDRTKASATAKPFGLYLVGVDYPKRFELPEVTKGPLFFM